MSNCRGCGKPMNWGIDQDSGAKVPLDPIAPVYEIGALDEATNAFSVKRVRASHAVSHFATCPQAKQFSGKNAKQ